MTRHPVPFGLGICGLPGPEDYGTGHGDAREFRSPQEPQEFHWSPVKLEESCRRDFSCIAKSAWSGVVAGITCDRVVIVKCRESVEGRGRSVFDPARRSSHCSDQVDSGQMNCGRFDSALQSFRVPRMCVIGWVEPSPTSPGKAPNHPQEEQILLQVQMLCVPRPLEKPSDELWKEIALVTFPRTTQSILFVDVESEAEFFLNHVIESAGNDVVLAGGTCYHGVRGHRRLDLL